MHLLSMLGRASLRSPRLLGSMASAAVPILCSLQQSKHISSTTAAVSQITVEKQHVNLVPLVAAGALLSILTASSEPSDCMGKKRKKGTVVEEFYEVETIKARRIVKGGGVEYLIHWKSYDDTHDTWEPLSNLSGMKQDLSAFDGGHPGPHPGSSRVWGRG